LYLFLPKPDILKPMSLCRIAAFSLTAILAALAAAQADQKTLDRIVKEGQMNNQVMDHVIELSTKIGHRLTASPNLEKSYEWALKKFRDVGCVNVRLEEWGEWPLSFHRGPSTGKMVTPSEFNFEFTTPSWTRGTDGPARGSAIPGPKTVAEFEAIKNDLVGKWIVYKQAPPRPPRARSGENPPELTPEQQEALKLDQLIRESGALGRIVPSRNELVVTSGNFNVPTVDDLPKDITITVRKSDMERIFENLDSNRPVELEFNLDHQIKNGPVKNYNIIAEIKGTEKPDEIVLMGGHIDSWDGPGSQGAADNATGVASAIEAARILIAAKAKPKRTIRFILFTGEEQGLYGSRRYVEMHKNELDKHSCIFIEDGGANYEGGTYVLDTMEPMFKPIVDVMNRAFPALPMKTRTVQTMPRGGGSDHVPFNAVGVPGFFWDETGNFNYTYVHHTQHDRAEMVPMNYMYQSATNNAVSTYIIACAPTLMPRAPRPNPFAELQKRLAIIREDLEAAHLCCPHSHH
jgi:hypothetical protein